VRPCFGVYLTLDFGLDSVVTDGSSSILSFVDFSRLKDAEICNGVRPDASETVGLQFSFDRVTIAGNTLFADQTKLVLYVMSDFVRHDIGLCNVTTFGIETRRQFVIKRLVDINGAVGGAVVWPDI
jgi:hypothetical protein